MARWTDLAAWRGPTPNQGGRMLSHRGLVVHIAEGTYEGTIAWCRNPAADVSAHFVVARDGRIAQLVDTDTVAWCQRAGNSAWLSVENEGRLPTTLTAAQVEANARLLARAHQVYGVPLQVATSPSGRGLGHHSMGADWGHQACPGPAIIGQKPAIVARAKQIIGGDDMTPEEHQWLKEVRTALCAPKSWRSDRTTARLVDDMAWVLIEGRPGTETTWIYRTLAAIAEKAGITAEELAQITAAAREGAAAGVAAAAEDVVDEAELARQVLAALPPELARQVVDEAAARLGGTHVA